MRHRGRRIAFALIAVLVLGLSACSGDGPSPPATPSPSPYPAETSTPEITATKPSLLLGQPTEDSAAAFVKYFWAAHNYAYATYDTSILEAISRPSCRYCAGKIDKVRELQSAGSRVSGLEAYVVTSAFPADESITTQAYLVVAISQRPGTITTASHVTKVDGVKNSRLAFGLDWDGGKWLVRGVNIQDKGEPWPA